MVDYTTRIKILSVNEIQQLYGLPKFSSQEQEFYFSIDSEEQYLTYSHRSPISQIFFILQLGYFKAKNLFFISDYNEMREDINFIKNKYFSHLSIGENLEINKVTRWNQQQKILTLYNYHSFDDSWKIKLQTKARQSVRISSKPIYLLKDLLGYLERSKVVFPSYSTIQDLISRIIIEEKERLCSLAEIHITNDIDRSLQELLSKGDNHYLLTIMKKESKDFKYKQIAQEIERQKTLKPLYEFAKDFLPRLEISNDNIKYCASLVDYYSIFRLKRLRKAITKIYLLCFIYHRYQRINDNLVNAFIYQVRKYDELAKIAAKNSVYELKIESNKQMKNAGKVLNLFVDETISDETRFGVVKQLAFGILKKEKFPLVTQYISKAEFDEAEFEWKEVESLAKRFKKNLRLIFTALDIQSTSKKDSLIEAIDFLKASICKKKSLATIKAELFPQSFIGHKTRRYIIKRKKMKIGGISKKIIEICPNRYEFLVYSQVLRYLESGDIYVPDSKRFRSFESDLIDDERLKNLATLLQQLDLSFLSTPIEQTLTELNNQLEALLVEVNLRIKEGKNQAIKISTSGQNVKWSLPYNKQDLTVNDPIFENLPQIEVRDLLAFVDSQTAFMNAFTHILGQYTKNKDEHEAIAGSIIALATNRGLFKMAESSDLTYQALFSAMKNNLRLETLKNGNDIISNSTAQLPIFQYFNVEEDFIHSSSDGQKFETKIDTINARYSPKYFGLKKGIVSYTMVANNVPVNAKIIGANEHESHFVFDIVYNNTSDIQPDRHSVDSHGTNHVNFFILHAFGYEFAPRYRDISSKSETLYGFKNPKHYNEMLLKPMKRVNQSLIIKEWPNILKILISLALKTTTQNVIISKLSSYARKNRTKKAIWEIDNIFRSIYLLNYVDDLLLRQAVQKTLNRGEAYHQLHRAIFHENGGKFRVDSEQEQDLWNECSRLVANAIIFYNSYLLSKLLLQMEKKGNPDLIQQVKKISPIAWRHINLAGRFEFTTQRKSLNIDSLLTRLANVLTLSKP